MSEEKYKIDSVHGFEARYKQIGGLQIGIPNGIRIEDIKNEIMVISLKGRSQLENKELAMSMIDAQAENKRLREALERVNKAVESKSKLFIGQNNIFQQLYDLTKQALGEQHEQRME